MNCDARGSELRGLGVDLWRIRAASYSTRGATTPRVVAAARVGGVQGTPAAALHPQPAREKGFPSNLLLD
jgi:hypothetical protein